jgi:hypothetical protein
MLRVGLAILFSLLVALPVRAMESAETIERSFVVPKADGHRTLVVDNISGEIDVSTAPGDDVELVLEQIWRGRSEREVARAKEAVVLEVEESAGRLTLKQGGPWRCKGESCSHGDYDVEFNWTLHVPEDIDLDLSNVNGGKIHVSNGAGAIKAKHVNGGVVLDDVRGAVEARTVNGRVMGSFATAPSQALDFRTVNGQIDLTFPSNLDSNIEFSTMNGELYTDFKYTVALPPAAARESRLPFMRKSSMQIRVGNGGVPIRCNTVNGNITIHAR